MRKVQKDKNMKITILQIFTTILTLGLFCGAAAAVAPTADFITKVTAPLSVTFTNQSVNDATSLQWDFGDGNHSTEQNPIYNYASPGKYTVNLTASNRDGSNAKSKEIIVLAPRVLTADFEASVTQGPIPMTVGFTDKSINATPHPGSGILEMGAKIVQNGIRHIHTQPQENTQ